MGSTVSILLPEQQAPRGVELVSELFDEWEQVLSRFLPLSELTSVNRQAGLSTPVSDLFYKVLTTAVRAAQATNGVYDPTMLNQLVQAGYDRNFEDLPAMHSDDLFTGAPGGGWRNIRLDAQRQRVTLPAGTKLDFGGIAKGMAVDAALAALRLDGFSTAIVNAGGDLAISGLPTCADSWPIAVPGRDRFWTLPLRQGAIATSGIAYRHWWQGQELRHHLLDPHTGLPAQSDLWSVTVVADRCEQAEVAAKVAFILGAREGAEFLHKHQLAALLVHTDSTWEAVEPWPLSIMEEK
jgi:thiamine biosynthesis lipoprotein